MNIKDQIDYLLGEYEIERSGSCSSTPDFYDGAKDALEWLLTIIEEDDDE